MQHVDVAGRLRVVERVRDDALLIEHERRPDRSDDRLAVQLLLAVRAPLVMDAMIGVADDREGQVIVFARTRPASRRRRARPRRPGIRRSGGVPGCRGSRTPGSCSRASSPRGRSRRSPCCPRSDDSVTGLAVLVGKGEVGGRSGPARGGWERSRTACYRCPSARRASCEHGWVRAPLAQLAEQLTLNQWVPGSSPGGCTTSPTHRPPRPATTVPPKSPP